MWFSEWSVPIVLKGCHRQTYSNISNIWQANSNFQIFPDISRYFQIFPLFNSRCFRRRCWEMGLGPAPSDGRPTSFERHLVTDGPQAVCAGAETSEVNVNVCHILHKVSRIRSRIRGRMFHFTQFQYVSICFYMFQLTSETLSANSSVKTAVNTMQTGSLISGFLHCQIQQVEPKNINWFKRFSERIT